MNMLNRTRFSGRTLAWLTVFVLAIAWTSDGFAQRNTVAALGDVPATLEEALARAMQRNPEIVTAEAKLELADAELNGARMEVSRKIIILWYERLAQEEIRNSVKRTFEEAERRHKLGIVGGEENAFESARIAVIDAQAKLARIDSELRYLIGRAGAPSARNDASGAAAKPGHTPASLQLPHGPAVEAVRRALLAPTTLEFVETPLGDVITYLMDLHKINIQLDERALVEIGCMAETPITIKMDGVPLAAALQALEDKLGHVKFVVRDYGILVTGQKHFNEAGYFPVAEFARWGSGQTSSLLSELATPAEPLPPVKFQPKSPPLPRPMPVKPQAPPPVVLPAPMQ